MSSITRSGKKDFIGKPKKQGLASEKGAYRDFEAVFLNVEGGAGLCFPCAQVGLTQYTFVFEHDPLATRIERLDFLTNLSLFADCSNTVCDVDPEDIACDSVSQEVNISIGIWHNDSIPDEEITRQTAILGGPWQGGYDFSIITDPETANFANAFPGDISQFVKQPNDPDYTGKVYVTLRWESDVYFLPCSFSQLAFTSGQGGTGSEFRAEFRNYQYEKSL